MPRTVTNVGHQPLGYWRRIPTTAECNRVANEAEAVVNPEVEQLLSILDLNDQPPSIYENVTLRKPRAKRIELHQPRPMRQLAIRGALAHFEEVVNHANEEQRPVATQPSVDAAPKPKPFNPVKQRKIRPPPLFDGSALPLRGRVPATQLHQTAGPSTFKPPRSSPFRTTRVRPPAPKVAAPIPIPMIRGCRIPSPDLPIHLHHHHGELPPSIFKHCRALIESSEEAAEWWGAFEAEPEPEEDEDEESLNGGGWNYARRGSFRNSPDASEVEDGWARAARGERTADIDDLDVADDKLLEAETDSEWFFTPPTSPDPYFPHARPVSPGMLESGLATVRLVPKSTTSAELDPPLPLQGQGVILDFLIYHLVSPLVQRCFNRI